MLLIPAIDFKNGQTRFGSTAATPPQDPADWAAQMIALGASRLQVFDLDAYKGGKSSNAAAIKAILQEAGDDVPVQIGGGLRDLDTIERLLDDGAAYVVIGTAAVKGPGFLHDACSAFGGHILVALDARGGKVATDGWSKLTGHEVIDLAKKYEDYGIEGILYTDLGEAGNNREVAVAETLALAEAVDVPIYACGQVLAEAPLQAVCTQLAGRIAGLVCSGGVALDWAAAQQAADAASGA